MCLGADSRFMDEEANIDEVAWAVGNETILKLLKWRRLELL